MKEATLRKWHRRIGLTFALLLLVQGGTGLFLTIQGLSGPAATREGGPDHGASREGGGHDHATDHGEDRLAALVSAAHHGGGALGAAFRILVGVGTVAMAGTGLVIFSMSAARMRRRKRVEP